MDDNDLTPQQPEQEPGLIDQIESTAQAAENAAANVVGKIQMISVQSSDIAAWGYDPVEFELQIQFTNNRIYIYESVSPLEFEQLTLSQSKGKAFWAMIRRNPLAHPFRRVQ